MGSEVCREKVECTEGGMVEDSSIRETRLCLNGE